MKFDTGNKAADKLLEFMGDEFIAMPWFNDEGTVEFVTLVDDASEHAVALKFVDGGEPSFLFNDMTFASIGPDDSDSEE